jgi:hypothetical protein
MILQRVALSCLIKILETGCGFARLRKGCDHIASYEVLIMLEEASQTVADHSFQPF